MYIIYGIFGSSKDLPCGGPLLTFTWHSYEKALDAEGLQPPPPLPFCIHSQHSDNYLFNGFGCGRHGMAVWGARQYNHSMRAWLLVLQSP